MERWIRGESRTACRAVVVPGAVVLVQARPDGDARLSPEAARELALELMAAAERIDPRPPPRDRADRPTRGKRRQP